MNDEVAAAVRSLESSRAALAGALASGSRTGKRRGAAGDSLLGMLWDDAAAAAKNGWERSSLHSGLQLARPAVEDAVRRQPWTAVTVAALCGAVAIWVVSARRRWILSAAGLWWRTAGATMLASVAIRLYEQFVAAPAAPRDAADAAPPAAADESGS